MLCFAKNHSLLLMFEMIQVDLSTILYLVLLGKFVSDFLRLLFCFFLTMFSCLDFIIRSCLVTISALDVTNTEKLLQTNRKQSGFVLLSVILNCHLIEPLLLKHVLIEHVNILTTAKP